MSNSQANVLIVDDEFSVRDSLFHWFRKDGYHVVTAKNAIEALDVMQKTQFDVILLDIKMPGMDGIELQSRIHKIDPSIAVIMFTAFASVDTAVRALKQGAFDYVTKPINPDELSHLIRRALNEQRLQRENKGMRETIEDLTNVDTIIGKSPQIRKVLELIQSVAQTDATVLVRGESGTGKELIAKAIHAQSRRRYSPIIPVSCGALSPDLLESELFGHEKGAFTGAQYRRKGKLELADGGTLFLDEIGTITPRTQIELLRVLESKEFCRVGGSKPIKVDFRIICATNEDLETAVAEGRFREDLYYRINVFTIVSPALRERRSDVALLAEHFLHKFSMQMDKHISEISPEAMNRLLAHPWPGNVRELANAIERAMVVGKPPAIQPGDLPFLQCNKPHMSDEESLSALEEFHISHILDRYQWNITRSAEALGIDRTTLYKKIKRYGLQKE